jgi:hypothetical protein
MWLQEYAWQQKQCNPGPEREHHIVSMLHEVVSNISKHTMPKQDLPHPPSGFTLATSPCFPWKLSGDGFEFILVHPSKLGVCSVLSHIQLALFVVRSPVLLTSPTQKSPVPAPLAALLSSRFSARLDVDTRSAPSRKQRLRASAKLRGVVKISHDFPGLRTTL